MKKKILSALLAASLAISMLPWSALAAEGEETMQMGLNATYYQPYGLNSDGQAFCDIVRNAVPNVANGGSTSDGGIGENNRLFDESIGAIEAATSVLNPEDGPVEIGDLRELADPNVFGIPDDGFMTVMEGKLTVFDAGKYTFSTRVDNGLIVELTDPQTGETKRVMEFLGRGNWADGTNGVSYDAVTLEAKTYDVKAYFIEFWGSNLCELYAKPEGGDREYYDYYFELSDATAQAYGMIGYSGDYDLIANQIPTDGGGAQSKNFDANKKQYDATIDDIKSVIEQVNETPVVVPTITVSNLAAAVQAAGGAGDNAVLVEYEGYITPMADGEYTFGLVAVDNAVVMEIDDDGDGEYTRVLEYWAKNAWVDNNSGSFYDASVPAIELKAGTPYPFKASYLELDGGNLLNVVAKSGDKEINLDEGFVFTTTETVDLEQAKEESPLLAGPMPLGELGRGEKVIFDATDTENYPDGVQNHGVVLDPETKIATFNGNATYIELPSSITDTINASNKLVVETVIKAYNNPDHGVLASIGTSKNETADIQTALMGFRTGWTVKAIGMNDTCTKNVLTYGMWAKVKWVFDANGTAIYVNDVLVGQNKSAVVHLDKLVGNLRINKATISDWDDPGMNGQMAQFRISVNDPEFIPSNNAEIAKVTVKGKEATRSGDTFKVTVDSAVTFLDVDVVLAEEYASYMVASDCKSITVTAEDGTKKVYKLEITDTSKKPTNNNSNTNTNTNTNTVKTPTNGTAKVNGKTVLYKSGKKVTGTKVIAVGKYTYAVVKGYVSTGTKNHVVKISKTKSYVVSSKGIVQKSKKNKIVKVGKSSYIVNNKGVIQKNNKSNKIVKIGKTKYVVNKKGVVQKNKKTIKVGKVKYKTNKNGVAKKK